jgi:glyceraldehyde 3-phosphate dehydrogenase
VLLCSPPKEPPDRTVVRGVNDGQLTAADRIVSNASCTTHAAAPILQVLERAFGIERVPVDHPRLHQPAAPRRRAVLGPAARPRRRRRIIPQSWTPPS